MIRQQAGRLRSEQTAHLNGNLQCLPASGKDERVLMADLAEQVAEVGEREIGCGLFIDTGNHIALLNSCCGRGRSRQHLRYLKYFEVWAPGNHRDPALVLLILVREMGIRLENHLLMAVIEDHRKAPQQSTAYFSRDSRIAFPRNVTS